MSNGINDAIRDANGNAVANSPSPFPLPPVTPRDDLFMSSHLGVRESGR